MVQKRYNRWSGWLQFWGQCGWFPIVIGMISTIAVFGVWQQLLTQENLHIHALVRQEATALRDEINRSLASRISTLERMADRWEASGGTPKHLWQKDATNYIKQDYGYQAITWVDPSLRVRWVVPESGNEAAINLDASQDPQRKITMVIAKDLRQTLLTRTLTLAQGGQGFVAFVPLFVPAQSIYQPSSQSDRFDGFLAGVFRFQMLFDSILPQSSRYKVKIYDRNGLIYSQGNEPKTHLTEVVTIQAYSIDWELHIFPSAELLSQGRSLLPTIVLWGGFVGAWLLAWVTHSVQRAHQFAHRVKRMNQQLQSEIKQRHAIEISLRESEERWQLALRGNNDGIWDWNLQTNEVFFSSRWKEMLGFADEEIDNHLDEWAKRVHPDDLTDVMQIIQDHLAKKTPFYISEHRVKCKDGTYKWILDRGQALWDQAGNAIRMTGSHTDITERKHAEIFLQESEAKYRNLVNHLNAGFIVHAPDTHILQFNAAACRLLGLTEEQIVSRTAFDSSWHFIHEDGSLMMAEDYPVNRVLATGEPLENYMLGLDRGDRWVVWVLVNAFPEFGLDGQIKHIVVTFIDISDRKRAEIALEQELFRSQMLFNTSLDGVVVMDRLGNVVQASDSFARMLGYSATDILNLNITDWDIQWNQDNLTKPFDQNQLPPLFETRYCCQDRSIRDVEVTWTQFELDCDVFNLCICRDISDRKQAELDLAISQKRYQNLVENSPDIIERFDRELRHLYVSPALTELTGIPTEVFLGKTCRDLKMDETMIATWEAAATELLQSGQRQVIDFSVATLKGLRTFEMVIAPEFSEQQTIESILCISRDITERKEAEAALRQSEEKFRQIAENIHQVFFIQALNGEFLYVSPAYQQIWLQSIDRLYADQQTWLDIVHCHDRDRIEVALHQQITHQGSFNETYRILRPDGEIRWVSCQSFPLRDEFGSVTRFTGIAEDITQQKVVEEALRQSEATKQAIIEAIPDLLMRMSADGNELEFISNSHFNLIDLDKHWDQTKIADVLPPDLVQIRLRYVQAALASGKIKIYEQEILNSGMTCYEEVRIVPLPNDEVLVMVRDITERRKIEQDRAQVEAALLVSEERLKLALEVSENGLWDWWITTGSSYFSNRFYEMLGYTPGEIGMAVDFWATIIHPDDRNWVMERLNAHLRDQSIPYAFEYRLRCKSGAWKWIANYGKVVSRDEHGNPLRIIGIHQDIDTRKHAEQQLKQQAEILQIFYEASPLMLGVVEVEGEDILSISHNPSTRTFFGVTEDKLAGKWSQELGISNQIRYLWLDHYYQSQVLQQPVWFEYEDKGRSQWLSVMVSFIGCSEEQRSRFSYIIQDISERKRLEAERERSEAEHRRAEQVSRELSLLESILDIILAGYWDWDFVHNQEYFSPGFKRMLGYDDNELPNHPETWQNLIWQDDISIIWSCFDTHVKSHGAIPFYAEVRYHHKDGSTVWVASSGQVIEWDGDGHPMRMIGCHIDISDRKRQELELRQAMEAAEAANLAKSAFLANMSHELRTPLNVILGFTQIMEHDEELTHSQQEDLQTIRRSADHLLSLINNVLDLSKIEAGHSTLEESGFDLISLLHTLRTMMTERAKAKRIQLIVEISPTVPQFVIADEQKLRQILLNLLSNAIKFTDEGHVALQVSSPLSDEIAPQPPGAIAPVTLQFEVSDTGIGIAVSEQTTIFDAFVQAEAGKRLIGGTGLGLTISRKLVELMHGEITLHSVPNVGSTFIVMIPVQVVSGVETQPRQRDRTIIGLLPEMSHRRILVVDDQPENRMLMVRIMQQLGLDVREASNGQEAIQIWQEWQPDLTWMDIRMPGMDGYEATKWIREYEKTRHGQADSESDLTPGSDGSLPRLKPTPSVIIALTAQASQSDRSLALAAGCDDYISKPFREETLFLKMGEYLGLEYVYADSPSSTPAPMITEIENFNEVSSALDPALLDLLSIDWIHQLEDAAICGRDRIIIELATQLPPEQSVLSQQLKYLAEQFEFEYILDWLSHHPGVH